MNVILLNHRDGRARQFDLRSPLVIAGCATLVLALLGTTFAAGSLFGSRVLGGAERQIAGWSSELAAQRAEVEAARQLLQQKVDALAMRVGQMNAHVIRLDALGKRLTAMAKLDKGEFDFDSAPPVGGFEHAGAGATEMAASAPVITEMLDRLSAQLEDRERQLGALENVILTRELRHEILPQGRPVRTGFISSFFGYRVDPFTGRTALHAGVDFAGPKGSTVVAVATGVVSFVGEKMGYGNVVEVNHGNGYVTRYAHNAQNLVKVGETVQKGDPLSTIGSTGRSTGPHLHFEVLRDGRQVDPMAFINRNAAPPLQAAR